MWAAHRHKGRQVSVDGAEAEARAPATGTEACCAIWRPLPRTTAIMHKNEGREGNSEAEMERSEWRRSASSPANKDA